jgi:hypothetical protein
MDKQVLRCGGAFDPDSSGVGHQPMGFDEWATFYQSYLVVASRVYADFCLTDTTTTPVLVGVVRTASSSLSQTLSQEFMEQGACKYALLSPSVSGPVVKSMVLDYDAKREYSLDKVKDNESRIGAYTTANPSEDMYFCLWNQSLDQSTTSAVSVNYRIEYDIIFSEPKLLPQS